MNWQQLPLADGLLREAVPEANRMVLWRPGEHGHGFRSWQRISSIPRAAVTAQAGLCAIPAVGMPARQSLCGPVRKLLHLIRRRRHAQTWALPNGDSVEQWGERQSDLLLVWPKDDTTPINEMCIRARWPHCRRVEALGPTLFLVSGIEPPQEPAPAEMPSQVNPRQQAEAALATARRAGDRHAEAAALTDLGSALVHEGKAGSAVDSLQEALTLIRQLGDREREADVLSQLGFALLSAGEPQRAKEPLTQAWTLARASSDRYAEKFVLARLGLLASRLGDHTGAIRHFNQALALTRDLADRRQEAELLWFLSIQYAELGQREQALAVGQACVDLLQGHGKPQAAWFAHHLTNYRTGARASRLVAAGFPEQTTPRGAFVDGAMVATVWAAPSTSRPIPTGDPGLLRMGFSAGKAMAQFLGSAFKTVSRAAYQKRLATCAACEHHTGVRCRLCGCFTGVKAWMAHEECPLGKWRE